jgi:hypothetical protein
MGIDIYAVWKGQTEEERACQLAVRLLSEEREIGYLREPYHGEPNATRFLFREAFASKTGEAPIPAKTLRKRLPHALKLIEQRELKIYHMTDWHEIHAMEDSYISFVELCERKERQKRAPVLIRTSSY